LGESRTKRYYGFSNREILCVYIGRINCWDGDSLAAQEKRDVKRGEFFDRLAVIDTAALSEDQKLNYAQLKPRLEN
jgi:hypothetical protein